MSKVNAHPLPAAGLPAWAVVELDGLLGAGILSGELIDRLKTDELLDLAREAVRARHAGFDPAAVIDRMLAVS